MTVAIGAFVFVSCSTSPIPPVTAQVREVWGDQLPRRDDWYYWINSTVGRDVREPAGYVAPNPTSVSVPLVLERIRSRQDLPGELWDNVLVIANSPVSVRGPILDFVADSCLSCALWFAYDSGSVLERSFVDSPDSMLADMVADDGQLPLEWMIAHTVESRVSIDGIGEPHDLVVSYPFMAALSGNFVSDHFDYWWGSFDRTAEAMPNAVTSYKFAAFIGTRFGEAAGRRAIGMLGQPFMSEMTAEFSLVYIHALISANLKPELQEFLSRTAREFETQDWPVSATMQNRLLLAVALAQAHLGMHRASADSLISLVESLDHIRPPIGRRPFGTTLVEWKTDPVAGQPLTLEELVYRLYVIHPQFDAITRSALHSELWDAIDLKYQTELRNAIERREAGEAYLQDPADYWLARSLLATLEQLQPLIDRLDLR